jgi:hypothetical protein
MTTEAIDQVGTSSLERAKAILDRISGSPCGTIPKADLKAASQRVLSIPGGMQIFCRELFPKGSLAPCGDYWETLIDGEYLRIW